MIWLSGLTAGAKRRLLRDLGRSLKRLRAEANELELIRAELLAVDEACSEAIWSIESSIASLKAATLESEYSKKRRRAR